MNIEQKMEWLRPERIQKLYDGQKSHFGMNRLLVIGIGKNGVDCVLRCIHLTEKRFGKDPKKVRFLCIGEEKQLGERSYEGSVPADGFTLPIDPEEAIYKYLNNPAKLSEPAQMWFDSGLKNYSPSAPTYGLTKRQCGRIALFHYLKQIMKLSGEAMADFSGSDRSLEIVITGNLGDVFCGGMFIDLPYILTKLFADVQYPVKVTGYFFAADTAALIENDQRDVGCYQANTIVAKSELDKFQLHRRRFTQKYSRTFEVDSEKPPYSSVFLIPAAGTYELTMSRTAEKILNRMEMIFSKDDDAERILSYNMLRPDAPHDFRYLAFDVCSCEVPTGKIMSYLAIKLFERLNRSLNRNDVGEMALKRYSGLVDPTCELVASKSGSLPTLEIDERADQAFSARAIKGGGEAALSIVEKWISAMSAAVTNGTSICVREISESVIADCEAAKTDFARGPFYAQEIIRKCLSELRVAQAKITSGEEDRSDQLNRTRDIERAAMRKVRSSTLFSGKAVEQYLVELKYYADAGAAVSTSKPMSAFYQQLSDRLTDYYENVLQKAIAPFEQISVNRGGIIEDIKKLPDENTCVREAFDINDEDIRAKLDELSDSIPDEKLEKCFKESGILDLPEDDERALGKAVVRILRQCFAEKLSLNYSEMCDWLGRSARVGDSIRECVESSAVTAPVDDSFAITRIICPNAVRQEDIITLRKEFRGVNYIWNGSICAHYTAAAPICGGVQIEKFSGYEQWENMHYAYVNDSLKKHGIRIFS